jgi:hypothetical protein
MEYRHADIIALMIETTTTINHHHITFIKGDCRWHYTHVRQVWKAQMGGINSCGNSLALAIDKLLYF